MRNPVGINMKKDEIVVRISEGAEHKEIIECLNKKIPALKKLYKTEKTPIFVMGKVLKNKEINEIKKIIQDNIDVEVNFDSPKVLGLHGIKRVFEKEIENSETKFHKGSLRSGQKVEFEGSLVVLGDVIMTPEEIMIQEVGSFLDQYGWILLLGAVVGITILVLIIVFIVINIKKNQEKKEK